MEQVQQVEKAQKSIKGTYATGKGTTQRILNFLQGRSSGRSLKEIAEALKVPGRQLSKRLAEQVRNATITFNVDSNGVRQYELTSHRNLYADYHPDFLEG